MIPSDYHNRLCSGLSYSAHMLYVALAGEGYKPREIEAALLDCVREGDQDCVQAGSVRMKPHKGMR